jgi:hypothetical protein
MYRLLKHRMAHPFPLLCCVALPGLLVAFPGFSGAPREGIIREADPAQVGPRLLLAELRLKVFRYDVQAPPDHKTTFWIEVRRKGKPDPHLYTSRWIIPREGSRFDGHFQFSIWDGDALNSPRSRWSFITEQSGGASSSQRWLKDPLDLRTRDSSWGEIRQWRVAPGQVATLLVLRADRQSLVGPATRPENIARADVAVLLKARFDPLSAGERRERPYEGASDIMPPAQRN